MAKVLVESSSPGRVLANLGAGLSPRGGLLVAFFVLNASERS